MGVPFRISGIPSYLIKVAEELKTEEKNQRIAKFNQDQSELLKHGRVNRRWAQSNMKMIDHGFGVMEHEDTGSVWYVEGDTLVRQSSDEEIEAVIASLK